MEIQVPIQVSALFTLLFAKLSACADFKSSKIFFEIFILPPCITGPPQGGGGVEVHQEDARRDPGQLPLEDAGRGQDPGVLHQPDTDLGRQAEAETVALHRPSTGLPGLTFPMRLTGRSIRDTLFYADNIILGTIMMIFIQTRKMQVTLMMSKTRLMK